MNRAFLEAKHRCSHRRGGRRASASTCARRSTDSLAVSEPRMAEVGNGSPRVPERAFRDTSCGAASDSRRAVWALSRRTCRASGRARRARHPTSPDFETSPYQLGPRSRAAKLASTSRVAWASFSGSIGSTFAIGSLRVLQLADQALRLLAVRRRERRSAVTAGGGAREVDRRPAVRAVDRLDVAAQRLDLLGRERADEILLPQEIEEADQPAVAAVAAPVLEARVPLLVVGQDEP